LASGVVPTEERFMNIEYVARNLDIDGALRSYAEGKIAKTAKFLEDPVDIHLTLEAEKHRRIAELRISHRFGHHVATESETDDIRDAINLVVDKMEKQVRRSREKFLDKRRRAASPAEVQWPVDVIERDTLSSGRPRIVKSGHLEIRTLTIDEAAEALEASSNDFVVFRNALSEKINVLYKRHDENFGLITQDA